MELTRNYPHITFNADWNISSKTENLLGQCEAFRKAIINVPITLDEYQKLLTVSLQKGAQATTAIEGNTLTEDEIREIIEKKRNLPPSREYLQTEVVNIHSAFNTLLREICFEDQGEIIDPVLIQRFHKMIGQNIGDQFQAIPGKFRQANVTVGYYRCPDYSDVPQLITELCNWLQRQFGYGKKEQSFRDVIIQAIVTHVYTEWIHPFSDGNGRTGRLLEFYILLRGGNPDIASHLLSNHYNNTRTEYYRQLQNATDKRKLTDFIDYAILGFRDGLENTLEIIQKNQYKITWKAFIFDSFNQVKPKHQEDSTAFNRRRILAQQLPINKEFTLNEVPLLSIVLAGYYSPNNIDNPESVSQATLKRDIEELVQLSILKPLPDGKFIANTDIISNLKARIKPNQLKK